MHSLCVQIKLQGELTVPVKPIHWYPTCGIPHGFIDDRTNICSILISRYKRWEVDAVE